MTRFLLLTMLLAMMGCTGRYLHDKTDEGIRTERALSQMMYASAAAWTADDLDAFMLAFHNSPDLTFATPTGITKGWAPLKERYAKSIAKSDLWFTDIETTVITADTALVFARFHNEMKADQSYSTGLTTLLCQKIDGNWVIVHDHSSGLPANTPRKGPQ
ncbi:MAG: nuclear transport factor 2 family protein [Phycisphaeraceae bacterium]|nr:nuclear transport factor 2 family protein [Phycisphaeraceae bacterium]